VEQLKFHQQSFIVNTTCTPFNQNEYNALINKIL
jgi:hypothetical protein